MNKTLSRTLRPAALALAVFACAASVAQPAPPNPADSIQTVTVAADHTVTFRLYAPKASTVTVSGDFPVKGPVPLTKAESGVWSFTTPPLPPDSYTYNFSVDGLSMLDQRSQNFKENPNSLFNFFDMPGPETDFMALKAVPHGRVESVYYHSTTLKMERRFHVYLPPNFESLKGPLPVFYLLHGYGDNDISWTSAGKMNLILDNLYAAGKLKNMIVIMPAGHVPSPPGTPMMAFSPNPEGDLFVQDFLTDLMPFVAKTYPISMKREDTAIAGFSMGGGQTLKLALFHPELFAYVFPVSTGFFPDAAVEMDAKYSAQLKYVAAHPFRQLAVGKGKEDMLLARNNEATLKMFDKNGIKYTYTELNGGHSFVFSRRYLAMVFPLAFQ